MDLCKISVSTFFHWTASFFKLNELLNWTGRDTNQNQRHLQWQRLQDQSWRGQDRTCSVLHEGRFHPPSSEEEEEEEETTEVGVFTWRSSLKWAMVIHQLPSSPRRPGGSAWESHRALLFFSSLLSHLLFSSICPLLLSEVGCKPSYLDHGDIPSALFRTVVLTLFSHLISWTFSCADLQGGPDAPRHPQTAWLHTLCVRLRHSFPHRLHPDAIWRRLHPRRRLHGAGSALWGQEVQRLARSEPLWEGLKPGLDYLLCLIRRVEILRYKRVRTALGSVQAGPNDDYTLV